MLSGVAKYYKGLIADCKSDYRCCLIIRFVLRTNKTEGSILPIEPSVFTYLAALLFVCGQHLPASAGNPAPIGRSQSLICKVIARISFDSSIGAGFQLHCCSNVFSFSSLLFFSLLLFSSLPLFNHLLLAD
jgi:hypothetical protein